jgi:hypothetical protein
MVTGRPLGRVAQPARDSATSDPAAAVVIRVAGFGPKTFYAAGKPFHGHAYVEHRLHCIAIAVAPVLDPVHDNGGDGFAFPHRRVARNAPYQARQRRLIVGKWGW